MILEIKTNQLHKMWLTLFNVMENIRLQIFMHVNKYEHKIPQEFSYKLILNGCLSTNTTISHKTLITLNH